MIQTTEQEREVVRTAFDWLERLPLLGVDDLSLLLNARQGSVSRTFTELERRGWVEWVFPESPETSPARLYLLAKGGGDVVSTETHDQDRKEILLRLARLETTMAFNRFAAVLVQAASHDSQTDLVDIRSLPLGVNREGRWWPPEIEGYGCLREGSFRAPFFIAWDRAGAPDLHRRIRVSGWYAFGDSKAWGGRELPAILVVCPREREIEQWVRLATASADRRGCAPLSLALATSSSAWREPLGAIWRRVDATCLLPLRERVRWDVRAPSQAESAASNPKPLLQGTPQSRSPLRDWARALAEDERRRNSLSEGERVGVLALAANGDHKTLLKWIGHHPLLSPADLSVLLDMSADLVDRLLKRLSEWRLVGPIARAANGRDRPAPRFFLTIEGLKLLAAQDGVPWQRYFRHGVLAAPAQGKRQRDRLKGFLNQFEHTVGVNSFFVCLAASATSSGRLLRWVNAAESTKRYGYGGKTLLLRPDASGTVAVQDRVCRFFLEWDRGTMRGKQMREKFHYYAAYFASRGDSKAQPAVLIVTNSPHRENAIWHDLEEAFGEINGMPSRFFTSIDSLIRGPGPFARVWRSFGSSRRVAWPDSSARREPGTFAEDSTTKESGL